MNLHKLFKRASQRAFARFARTPPKIRLSIDPPAVFFDDKEVPSKWVTVAGGFTSVTATHVKAGMVKTTYRFSVLLGTSRAGSQDVYNAQLTVGSRNEG